MKYSIIIAVYNRLEEVKELLESAEKLDGDRSLFELLFVDDGSKDGFKEFIEQYHSTSGLQIRAIYQKNQGPGAARNQGMSKAQGEYFIFVDSDCMFPPQWLTEIEKAQNEHHYDAFGGPDTCHPSFSPLLKAINYSMTSFIGTGGTRGNKKHVGRFYPRSFHRGIQHNWRYGRTTPWARHGLFHANIQCRFQSGSDRRCLRLPQTPHKYSQIFPSNI